MSFRLLREIQALFRNAIERQGELFLRRVRLYGLEERRPYFVFDFSEDFHLRFDFSWNDWRDAAEYFRRNFSEELSRLYSVLFEDAQLDRRHRLIRDDIRRASDDPRILVMTDQLLEAEREAHYRNRQRDMVAPPPRELVQELEERHRLPAGTLRSLSHEEFERLNRQVIEAELSAEREQWQSLAVPEMSTITATDLARTFEALPRRDGFAADQIFYFSNPAVMGWGVDCWGDDIGPKKARKRAEKLLRESLSPVQLKQLEKNDWFEVRGSDTGKRYRIKRGRQMNIRELDEEGKEICTWCFLPEGQCPAGDVMLAQKIALENFENKALATANRFDTGGSLNRYLDRRSWMWEMMRQSLGLSPQEVQS